VFSPGSAETNVGWGGKLNGHLMASCVRNNCTRNYQNLIIDFQVTVENVRDVTTKYRAKKVWTLTPTNDRQPNAH